MNARHYDTRIARFISPDSLVPEPLDGQSFNRYAYTRNKPLARVDPTGHRDEEPDAPADPDDAPDPEEFEDDWEVSYETSEDGTWGIVGASRTGRDVDGNGEILIIDPFEDANSSEVGSDAAGSYGDDAPRAKENLPLERLPANAGDHARRSHRNVELALEVTLAFYNPRGKLMRSNRYIKRVLRQAEKVWNQTVETSSYRHSLKVTFNVLRTPAEVAAAGTNYISVYSTRLTPKGRRGTAMVVADTNTTRIKIHRGERLRAELGPVFAHELGHLFTWDTRDSPSHNDSPFSIMYSGLQRGEIVESLADQADIEAVVKQFLDHGMPAGISAHLTSSESSP